MDYKTSIIAFILLAMFIGKITYDFAHETNRAPASIEKTVKAKKRITL